MEAKDIVVALTQLGLTQTQIAEGSGVQQPTISKILRGEVSDVLSKNYRALHEFFIQEQQKAAS